MYDEVRPVGQARPRADPARKELLRRAPQPREIRHDVRHVRVGPWRAALRATAGRHARRRPCCRGSAGDRARALRRRTSAGAGCSSARGGH
eukprot:4803591-Alexandrium_andersonii.AAC.1